MHVHRHGRFYVALIAGLLVFAATTGGHLPLQVLYAGDTFFVVYLGLMAVFASRVTPDILRQRAAAEDEGVVVILLLSAGVVLLAFSAIFLVLNSPGMNSPAHALLAVASVVLGWFMVHTMVAFHYATLYYDPQDAEAGGTGPRDAESGGLRFPGRGEPGVWEFVYFAFTLGMAAQVSDVSVESTRMRRAVLVHSIAAFFYNAVLLALTVNAALTFATGPSVAG